MAEDHGGGGGGGGRKKKREYVPQKRSGGYAVLLALYRQSQVGASFKVFPCSGYMWRQL